MKNTILIIALVAITQSDYLLVHAKPSQNNQNGNTFFGFQFQPFQAKFEGHASYIHKEPELKLTATTAASSETTTAAGESYYEAIGARSGFNLNGEFDSSFNIFNVVQAISESIEQIVQTIARDVGEKISNAKNYTKVLGDNLQALINNYQYIRLRGSFLALKTTLESVNQYADILQATSEKVQQNLADQVTKVNNELLESVSDWSSIILERLDQRTDNNEWAQAQAQEKINEVINRYGAFEDSCKEEAYAELKVYEESIYVAVEKIEILQDETLNIIHSCIASDANPYDCVRDINGLIRDLRLSIYALRNLNVEGIRLNSPSNSYEKRRCVVQNSQELQLERLSVEIQIEYIRSQASNHPNVTPSTANPGSTSDQTTENPNQGSGSGAEQTTTNTNQGSGSTSDQTTENPNQGSSSGAEQTTANSNQGSGSTSDQTTENSNQSSGSGAEQTTPNSNQGSGSGAEQTTANSNQGSGSTSDQTTENSNQGSGSGAEQTSPNSNQGSGSASDQTTENSNQASGANIA